MNVARDVRDRYTDAFNAHDMKALLSTFSPAGVSISPEGVSQGHSELASYLEEFWTAFPDVRAVITESSAGEATTVDELLMVGTHRGPYTMPDGQVLPATDRPLRLRCCYVCTVEDGLITSLRLYFDQLELLTQLSSSVTLQLP
ncbi:nuclear transport factor 2 family protein [Nonomuraea sp. NPDC001636]|uniref:ester cyclase n=1 Tax=Nonomuraea sp. NPDC001636 TaxID=3154391 RepID=UPI00332F62DF